MATPSADAPLGLTEAEAVGDGRAMARIADIGAHPLRRAQDKFWSPIPWMLEGSAILEFALGKFVEGAVIAVVGARAGGTVRKTQEPKPKQQGVRASCDRGWQGQLETSPWCSSMR